MGGGVSGGHSPTLKFHNTPSFKHCRNQRAAGDHRLCRWKEHSVASRAAIQLQLSTNLPPILCFPRALLEVALPSSPENLSSGSRAGPERVKGSAVTPPARGRGRKEAGGGGKTQRRKGHSEKQHILVQSLRPNSHDWTSRYVRHPRVRPKLASPKRGEKQPGQEQGPPELPSSNTGLLPQDQRSAFPNYGCSDYSIRVQKSPPCPLPLQGRYSSLLRGGVSIKQLRSLRRGKSATGRLLKAPFLKPQVPALSRFLSLSLSLALGTCTSTLLGTLACGRGARAPPSPRTQTAVPRDVAALNFCQVLRTHFAQRSNLDL